MGTLAISADADLDRTAGDKPRKLFLGDNDVTHVAAKLSVTPMALLRAARGNWELDDPKGGNRARQLILDAANAAGPGMASRGEYAYSLLRALTAPVATSWPCNRCGRHHSHPTSDYCGSCRVGD